MKYYDISRELFSAELYPGDPAPRPEPIRRLDTGDGYNLSALYTGCHCGTHIDAPLHFLEGGESVDVLPLNRFLGYCSVVTVSGLITGSEIDQLLPGCEKRLLFRGNGTAYLSQSGAFALRCAGILLVGTDAISIAPPEDETAPHQELLAAGIPVLEGLDLTGVPDGRYLLSAFPLKMRGMEASPCRAVLLSEK